MTYETIDAPRRALKICPDPTPRMPRQGVLNRLLGKLLRHARPKGIRHISDHLARDIGVGSTEMERHRLVLPSESPDRPRI